MKVLVTLVCYLFLFSPRAFAATLTVSPGSSIQSAINTAQAGDLIQVLAGNYQEQITISKSLSLKAIGSAKTLGFIIKADGITIEGFDISSPKTSSGFGVRIYNSNCKVLNNYIHDTWWDGILLEASSNNCRISNNKIERASQSGAEVRGSGHIIEYNEITDTIQTPPGSSFTRSDGADSDGFRFFGNNHSFIGNYIHDIKEGTATNPNPHMDCFQSWKDRSPRSQATNIVFRDNRCMLSWGNDKVSSAKMFQFGNVVGATVENNISRTRMVSIVQDGSRDITFLRNTFVGDGPQSWGIELNSGVTNVTVRDNIFYHQENGYGYLPKSVTVLDAGHNCVYTITRTPPGRQNPGDIWGKDPLFVNYAQDDFNLKPNSPCLGTGAIASSSPTPTPAYKPGDLNTDGSVNLLDFNLLIKKFGNPYTLLDFNTIVANFGKTR